MKRDNAPLFHLGSREVNPILCVTANSKLLWLGNITVKEITGPAAVITLLHTKIWTKSFYIEYNLWTGVRLKGKVLRNSNTIMWIETENTHLCITARDKKNFWKSWKWRFFFDGLKFLKTQILFDSSAYDLVGMRRRFTEICCSNVRPEGNRLHRHGYDNIKPNTYKIHLKTK